MALLTLWEPKCDCKGGIFFLQVLLFKMDNVKGFAKFQLVGKFKHTAPTSSDGSDAFSGNAIINSQDSPRCQPYYQGH